MLVQRAVPSTLSNDYLCGRVRARQDRLGRTTDKFVRRLYKYSLWLLSVANYGSSFLHPFCALVRDSVLGIFLGISWLPLGRVLGGAFGTVSSARLKYSLGIPANG